MSTNSMTEDYVGRTINLGDTIFYVSSGRYTSRIIGRVNVINPKMISIEVLRAERNYKVGSVLSVRPENCVLIQPID